MTKRIVIAVILLAAIGIAVKAYANHTCTTSCYYNTCTTNCYDTCLNCY